MGTIIQSERINVGVLEQNTNITFLYYCIPVIFLTRVFMSNGCLVQLGTYGCLNLDFKSTFENLKDMSSFVTFQTLKTHR